jgi:hypothetical protein
MWACQTKLLPTQTIVARVYQFPRRYPFHGYRSNALDAHAYSRSSVRLVPEAQFFAMVCGESGETSEIHHYCDLQEVRETSQPLLTIQLHGVR